MSVPVWKFRSHDEARRALWLEPDDPRIGAAIDTVLGFARLGPQVPPPRGVRKFRSIEEANADRELWVQQCVDAGRRRSLGG